MDWADELAASVTGPQVVNDSQDAVGDGPRRQPARPGHPRRHRPGAARARARDDAPLRRRRPRPDGRPGAPDPRRGRARDGPPARPRPGPAATATPPTPATTPQVFIDTFAGLGIHPDRYYWMSEHLPDRADGPVHPDRARPAATGPRRSTAASPTSSTRTPGCRSRSSARTAARSARPSSTDWDGETVAFECRPTSSTWAARLRLRPAGSSPFGGAAKLPWNLEWAAQWSLFGVTIEPCGKDLATAGGSRDRSDAIAREVFEREPPLNVAVRVPQHRRQEDVDVEGPGRRRARDRRGHPAGAAPASCSCARARTTRSSSTPTGPTRSRASSTSSIEFAAATAGREVKGDLPPGHEATFRYSLVDPAPTSPPRRPRSGPPFCAPGAARSRSRASTSPARVEAEKGSALTERGGTRSSRSGSRAARRGSRPTRRSAPIVAVRDAAADEAAAPRRRPAALSRRAGRPGRRAADAGDAWQDPIFEVAAAGPAGPRFGALYVAFLGDRLLSS